LLNAFRQAILLKLFNFGLKTKSLSFKPDGHNGERLCLQFRRHSSGILPNCQM